MRRRTGNAKAAFPLTTLWNALKLALGVGVPDPNYWLIDFLVVAVVVVAVLAGLRRLPLSYLTYALGSLLIPLSYPFPPVRCCRCRGSWR